MFEIAYVQFWIVLLSDIEYICCNIGIYPSIGNIWSNVGMY